MRIAFTALLLAGSALAGQAQAQVQSEEGSDRFSLGQIIVTAPRTQGIEIDTNTNTLSSNAIYTFGRTALDDAINLMPGVSSGNSGGTRNERLVFVRGFDRFQVPLSIDGIRVYLPADNRLDYGRFLTTDIAEVQVAKGYASVLDGPGAMGGAINLVTAKPTKALDIDLRGTVNFDNDTDYAGYNVSAKVGTRHDTWYAQASYARSFTDHWDLPNDFTPRNVALEDGGARDFSRTSDWRVNAKVGFTPNATDEYALSYTYQEGAKGAPLHISDTVTTPRYWDWPEWNITSVYFLSTTALGDRATLKTRAYYNQFDSILRSFTDRTMTTQTRPYTFDSPYEDRAWGGSAQLDFEASEADTLRLAFHYRHDKHVEYQTSFSTAGVGTTEPRQTQTEETFSAALENELRLTPDLRFTLGGSFDWRNLIKAQEYGAPLGTSGASVLYDYPRRDADTWNLQGRFDWQANEAVNLHASLSSRALPDHLRTVQPALQHRHPQSRSEGRTRHQCGNRRQLGGGQAAGGGRALLQLGTQRDLQRADAGLSLHRVDHAAGSAGHGLRVDQPVAEPQCRQGRILWRRTVGIGDDPAGAGRRIQLYRHQAQFGLCRQPAVPPDRRAHAQGLRLSRLGTDREAAHRPQRGSGVEPLDPVHRPAGQRAAALLSHRRLCECGAARRLCHHRRDRDRRGRP